MAGDRLSISQQVLNNCFLSQHMSPTDFFFFPILLSIHREGAGSEQVAMWYLAAV